MTRTRTNWKTTAAIGALAAGLLLVHASRYRGFIADDALISLRYSDRLLEGHGLTWTDGERVEGYSNLLWVLAVAGLGALGMDLIVAARVLGIVGAISTIPAVLCFLHRRGSTPLAQVFATFGLALAGPLAVWAVGGLEQSLLVALLAWSVVLLSGVLEDAGSPRTWRAWLAALLLGAICWTRPDGPLFAAVAALTAAACARPRREGLPLAAILAGVPLAFVLLQLAFRLVYYGDWFPNSAYAKLAFTSTRVQEGWQYLYEGLIALGGLSVPGLLGAVLAFRRPRRDPAILLVALLLVVWCSYVVFIGGDIFPARRHLSVSIVLLALCAATFFDRLERGRGRSARLLIAGVATLCLAILGWQQWTRDSANGRAITERWEWDGEVLGGLLRDAFGDKAPLLAVDPAGCVPYFSRLPSLDMLGINDRELARLRPAGFGHGWLGHELGNGESVLRRAPDILVFCNPAGSAEPCFASGRQLLAMPEFRQRHRLLVLRGERPYSLTSLVWMRLDSLRVGIVARDDGIEIPGYWFASGKGAVAVLDEEKRLVTRILPSLSADFERLPLGAGRWRLGGDVTGKVRIGVRGARPIDAAQPDSGFYLPVDGEISIRVEAGEGGAEIRSVRLQRVTGDV